MTTTTTTTTIARTMNITAQSVFAFRTISSPHTHTTETQTTSFDLAAQPVSTCNCAQLAPRNWCAVGVAFSKLAKEISQSYLDIVSLFSILRNQFCNDHQRWPHAERKERPLGEHYHRHQTIIIVLAQHGCNLVVAVDNSGSERVLKNGSVVMLPTFGRGHTSRTHLPLVDNFALKSIAQGRKLFPPAGR